jgi:hypothetical protein
MTRRLDSSDRGVLVTPEAMRRIQAVINRVDGDRRRVGAPEIPTAFDDASRLIIGRVGEAWPRGTSAAVEVINQEQCDPGSGDPGSGGESVDAWNLSFDVAANSTVILGEAENGCWYLVTAAGDCDSGSGSGSGCECPAIGGQDLTQLEGYDATKTQVLAHEFGCLKWIDTTECDGGSS